MSSALRRYLAQSRTLAELADEAYALAHHLAPTRALTLMAWTEFLYTYAPLYAHAAPETAQAWRVRSERLEQGLSSEDIKPDLLAWAQEQAQVAEQSNQSHPEFFQDVATWQARVKACQGDANQALQVAQALQVELTKLMRFSSAYARHLEKLLSASLKEDSAELSLRKAWGDVCAELARIAVTKSEASEWYLKAYEAYLSVYAREGEHFFDGFKHTHGLSEQIQESLAHWHLLLSVGLAVDGLSKADKVHFVRAYQGWQSCVHVEEEGAPEPLRRVA